MAKFQYCEIQIPQDAVVLVSVVLHESEIPKDAQERLVAQVQQGGTGGSPESVKVKLFHGGYKGVDGPAKLEFRKLLDQGFCINNIQAIADVDRVGFYTVRVWLTHDVSEKGMSLRDWGVAGEFVSDLFAYGWSGPKVVDHNDGKMISFGMYGKTIPGHFDRTILVPKVVAAKGEGPVTPVVAQPSVVKQQVPQPKAPSNAALFSDENKTMSAMALAFTRTFGKGVTQNAVQLPPATEVSSVKAEIGLMCNENGDPVDSDGNTWEQFLSLHDWPSQENGAHRPRKLLPASSGGRTDLDDELDRLDGIIDAACRDPSLD